MVIFYKPLKMTMYLQLTALKKFSFILKTVLLMFCQSYYVRLFNQNNVYIICIIYMCVYIHIISVYRMLTNSGGITK